MHDLFSDEEKDALVEHVKFMLGRLTALADVMTQRGYNDISARSRKCRVELEDLMTAIQAAHSKESLSAGAKLVSIRAVGSSLHSSRANGGANHPNG